MSKTTLPPKVNRAEVIALYRQAVVSGIPIEKIDHKIEQLVSRSEVSEQVEAQLAEERNTKVRNRVPAVIRRGAILIPMLFLSVGLYMMGSAVVPIANSYIAQLPYLYATNLKAPIPQDQIMDVTPLIITQAQATSDEPNLADLESKPVILDAELDYTNLSNWFDDTTSPELANLLDGQSTQSYMIDIPSLNIANAMVTVGGTNLNKSLIHYPGTALPGDPGAPVIFGHSVLRQFYNPSEKNPRRYNSIFSTIMTMKKGDKIYITNQGVKYTYVVQDRQIVKPEDVHILTQKYDSRQLKLVTCYPEGTYAERGVIIAALVPNAE